MPGLGLHHWQRAGPHDLLARAHKDTPSRRSIRVRRCIATLDTHLDGNSAAHTSTRPPRGHGNPVTKPRIPLDVAGSGVPTNRPCRIRFQL